MNVSSFLFASASFISGAFALGAISVVYLQFRTRVVRFMLLFILSLFLISSGFWSYGLMQIPDFYSPVLAPFLFMLQSLGSAVNVLVLPFLVTALINLSLNQKGIVAVWIWNSIFILGSLAAYLIPGFGDYMFVLGIMLVLTILFWIGVMIVQSRKIKDAKLKRSIIFFVAVSSVFVLFLILDMMITSIPILSLAFLDNFSMPLYFAAINIGSFLFAGSFLNKGAFADENGVTELFCRDFDISKRETDLINKLLEGKSNREISDELCISIKTVENHLYNIYRKADVTGRGQLIHMLHSWEKG